MENERPRKQYARRLLIIGIVFAVLGILLKLVNSQKLFDLPWILLIIGAIILISALLQFREAKNSPYLEGKSKTAKEFFLDNALMIAFMALIIIIAVSNTRFMQFRVLRDIFAQASSRIFVASGMTLLIISGNIDLSAGRQVGLAAVVSGSMMQVADYGHRFYPNLTQIPVILAIIAAIVVCMAFGAINGWLITKLKILPFIATLAVQIAIFGAASLYMNSEPNKAQPLGGFRNDFTITAQ